MVEPAIAQCQPHTQTFTHISVNLMMCSYPKNWLSTFLWKHHDCFFLNQFYRELIFFFNLRMWNMVGKRSQYICLAGILALSLISYSFLFPPKIIIFFICRIQFMKLLWVMKSEYSKTASSRKPQSAVADKFERLPNIMAFCHETY